MEFVSKSELNALRKGAENIGTSNRSDRPELMLRLMEVFDYYLIAGVDDHMKGEAVSVTADGDFLCVMIDTNNPDPVSFARQNFNNFPEADLTAMSGLLETVRVAYFADRDKKTPKIAA